MCWSPVKDLKPFLEEISVVQFTRVLYGIQIPKHCKEGIHHQQILKIVFEPSINRETAMLFLKKLGLELNLLLPNKNTYYGIVFTRPCHNGYWVLKKPCCTKFIQSRL
jgi:hypothetical protein